MEQSQPKEPQEKQTQKEYNKKTELNKMPALTKKQEQALKKMLKRGIYMELHKKGYLSDAQLNELISHPASYKGRT